MINDILNSLLPEQKNQLLYAFEQGFTQIVIYKPGYFVGVNVNEIGNLDLENQEGVWSCGRIKSA